jgi:hypothetical protein
MSSSYRCFDCDTVIEAGLYHNCWSEPKPAGDGVNDDTAAIASAIYSGKETSMDDWKADERTVWCLIEAIPTWLPSEAYKACITALENYLPKPDPVKALLEEYRNAPHPADQGGYGILGFARWLIDNDRIK